MPKVGCDRCGLEQPAEVGVMVSQNHPETNTLFGARAEAFVEMEARETIGNDQEKGYLPRYVKAKACVASATDGRTNTHRMSPGRCFTSSERIHLSRRRYLSLKRPSIWRGEPGLGKA
jgi:hypothetical protein